MTDATPLWLVRHVERETDGARFLNAKPVRRTRWLVNTSDGSVLVTRRGGGEPHLEFLEFPDHRAGLTCSVCDWHMEFVGTDFPIRAYCTNCGTLHELSEHGHVHRLGEPQTVLPPQVIAEKAERPQAAKVESKPKAPAKKRTVKAATQPKAVPKKKPAPRPAKKATVVKTATKPKTVAKPAKPAVAPKAKAYKPQCGALTADGGQCRNSARGRSKYCASHKGYQPPSIATLEKRADTKPRAAKAEDTLPSHGNAATKSGAQAQCGAITADGKQCKNSSRAGSKYCASHKGYRSGDLSKKKDTKPRFAKAADTLPSVRKAA